MPFILRGPGVPAGRTVARPGLEHRLRADAASTSPRRAAGRTHGRRLAAARRSATRRARPNRAIEIEAPAPLFEGNIPGQRLGPALQGRAHRPLHLRRLHGDRRAGALRPPHATRPSCATSPPIRPTPRSRRGWRRSWRSSTRCRGRACRRRSRERAAGAAPPLAPPRRGACAPRRRAAARQARAPRRPLLRDHRAQGRAARPRPSTVWNTIGLNTLPRGVVGRVRRAARWPSELGRHARRPQRARATSSWTRASGQTPGPCAPSTACGCARSATIRDPHRRRPRPDALHRPHDRAPQHAGAGGAGRTRLRARRARRRRLRDAELRADQRPDADARQAPHARPPPDLPPGWRYRTRRLRRAARPDRDGPRDDHPGRAAEHLPARDARPGAAGGRIIAVRASTGRTHTVTAATPGTVEDHGTVTGTPFGKGTIVLVGTLTDGRLTGTFRLTFPRGSIVGTVSMPFTITGNEIDFRGTSQLHRRHGRLPRASRAAP